MPALHSVLTSTMIRGFLEMDDTATALHWFTKFSPAAPEADASSSSSLPLPDLKTLEHLIRKMIQSGEDEYLEPLQHVFHVYLQESVRRHVGAEISALTDVMSANVAGAQRLLQAGSAPQASAALDRALDAAATFFAQESRLLSWIDTSEEVVKTRNALSSVISLANILLAADRVVDAGSALTYARLFLQSIDVTAEPYQELGAQLSQLGSRFLTIDAAADNADAASMRLFASAEYVAPVLRDADLLDEHVAASLAGLYRSVRTRSSDAVLTLPLSADAWTLILEAFCFEELNIRPLNLDAFKSDGVPTLLHDLTKLPAADASSADGTATRRSSTQPR